MNIQIKAEGMDLTDALRTYAEEKVRRLQKYLGDITPVEARVKLARTTNHHQKGDVFECQMQLSLPGETLILDRIKEDMYKAIDSAQEHMERSIAKYKEKHS